MKLYRISYLVWLNALIGQFLYQYLAFAFSFTKKPNAFKMSEKNTQVVKYFSRISKVQEPDLKSKYPIDVYHISHI